MFDCEHLVWQNVHCSFSTEDLNASKSIMSKALTPECRVVIVVYNVHFLGFASTGPSTPYWSEE
jgi:hypothetical protein